MKKLNIQLVLIACALVSIGQFASVVYLPAMPEITYSLHASSTSVGLTLTMYMFFFGFSQLLGGSLSDIFGRRPLIYFGMLLYIIAAIACATATSIIVLLIARAFEGLGAGNITSVARASLNDTHSDKPLTKAIGYTAITASLISMFAPLLGGFIQTLLNWRAIFWYLAIFCCVILVFSFIFFKETAPVQPRECSHLKKIFNTYVELLTNRFFITHMLSATLAFSAMSSYYVASPFLFQQGLHLSPLFYSLTFFLTSGGFIIGSIINQNVKLSTYLLMTLANFIMILSLLVLLVITLFNIFSIWSVLIPVSVMTACVGVLYPRGMSAAVAPFKHIAGTAAAFIGFSQMGLSALGVLIMAHLPKTFPLAMAIFLIVISLLSGVIYQINRSSSKIS